MDTSWIVLLYKKCKDALQCSCCAMLSPSVLSDFWGPRGLQPTRLLCPWDSTGKHNGVGCHALFQWIIITQGLNPGLWHCRQILNFLSHQGNPRILEWVAYPFSRESSWTRNQTGVSCITGGFFTSWATSEAPSVHSSTITIAKTREQAKCPSTAE